MKKSKQRRIVEGHKNKRQEAVDKYNDCLNRFGKDHVLTRHWQKKIEELDKGCKVGNKVIKAVK